MKRFIVLSSTGLALLAVLSSGAAAQVALGAVPKAPVPDIIRAAQVSVFDGGEYRSEPEARRALDAALAGLRQAGLAVVGARTVAPTPERKGYAIHIDYVDSVGAPGSAPRTIESYASGEYPSNSAAAGALSASMSNLASAGYMVLRGQVLARNGRWVYEVDYVRGRQAPVRRSLTFTSGYYHQNLAAVAQRDMTFAIQSLQAQGATIVSYGVFPVWGTTFCVYQVRYLGR